MKKPLHFINTPEKLSRFVADLHSLDWFALDTEFMRERTYRPELCLLQIATDTAVACIDPLALDSIDPVLDVIYNPKITKVLHAAGQDLEIFYWLRGEAPVNLFDTQVAAPLLGHQEQIGYANLVSEILGVSLSKSHSRADWTRRPLPKQQIKYAADDVIYLSQMYPLMCDKLRERGRLDWLDAEWQAMTNSNLYEKPADEVWKRVRGIDKLKASRLAVAQALGKWRELTARERNMPRNWLLKDDVLMDIAKQMPPSIEELKHIRGLSEGTIKSHGKVMVETIQASKDKAPAKIEQAKRKVKLSPQQDATLDLLQAVVKIHANQHQINPSVLAPRKSLEELIRGVTDTAVAQGWRRQLIGESLMSVLAGEKGLKVEHGLVVIE